MRPRISTGDAGVRSLEPLPLILLSRWSFLVEDYGMSSRYALQFQVGVVGILLTLALCWKGMPESRKQGDLAWCCSSCNRHLPSRQTHYHPQRAAADSSLSQRIMCKTGRNRP